MKNKGSLFNSLFILLSILTSVLIIIFVSWFYMSTSSNIKEDFLTNRKHNLEQMVHSLESELQNIEYAFNAYSTTSSYDDVIEYPLTGSDFQIYRDITTQLNYFSTPNLHNTTYSLISINQHWAINSGRLVSLTDNDVASIKDYYIENNPSSLYWDQDDSGMAVVTLLPIHSRDKNGIGIAHVSDNDINQLVNNQGIHFPLLILNTEGELLYDSDFKDDTLSATVPDLSTGVLQTIIQENNGELVVDDQVEEPFTLLVTESAYNNLLYVTALYDYEITETLTPTQLGYGTLGGLLILSSITLSWALSNVLTRPLRQLKAAIKQGNDSIEPSNDFLFLKNTFEMMQNEKDTLQLVLDVEKPALRRQFVLNAFLGKNNLVDLDEKQAAYNFPTIHSSTYFVLVSQLDSRISKDDTVRLFTLLHIIEEAIPEANQFTPVVISEESVGTILVFESDSKETKKKIIEYGETIVRLAKEEANVLVSIGLSPSYEDFNETRAAYKKARTSLSYKMLLGNQSIISFEDVKDLVSDSYSGHYFTELEQSIFNAIRLGNTDEAINSTYPFLASLFKHNPNPTSLEFALLRFFINLSKLDQTLETIILERSLMESFYKTVLFHRNLVDIENTLVNDMIVPMSEKMKSRTTEQFSQVSNRIKDIIHKDFEDDISLDTISEELNYNPNYLSSIFKKETGVTFSDYLIDFRFNKAKEWLIHSDLTVKDIAEKLKYGNSQNFIRSFKKREFLTPGQYRKQHKLT